MIEDYGEAFGSYYTSDGEAFNAARSKTYDLRAIADYLRDCMGGPQNDTKVTFEVRGDGSLRISTSNDEEPAEIEAYGFKEAER